MQEQTIITLGSFLLCIFLIMVMAASKIRIPTAILMPLNALAMSVISRKLSKNEDITNIIRDYVNQYEDPGHISYIVFRPENVIRQDMQSTETRTPGTRTYKPAEILPAHDMSHNHKHALMLEETHHS